MCTCLCHCSVFYSVVYFSIFVKKRWKNELEKNKSKEREEMSDQGRTGLLSSIKGHKNTHTHPIGGRGTEQQRL